MIIALASPCVASSLDEGLEKIKWLLCEAAAQITAYYTLTLKLNENVLMGLGGIENTRFRRAVLPGERLILVGKGIRVRSRMTLFNVQGYVGKELAFHTDVIGVVLGKLED